MPPEDNPSDDMTEEDYFRGMVEAERSESPEWSKERKCEVCGNVIPAGVVHEHLVPGPQFQPQPIYWIDSSG